MFDQLSLPGFDAAPSATDSLFFGILPDADAAERIARLAQRLCRERRLDAAPIATSRFHVTLYHLGDYSGLPTGIVASAREAAAAVAMPPFELAFDRVASFAGGRGKRPSVLRGSDGVVPLTALRQALGAAMASAGLARWAKSSFTPHVTLLYDYRALAEQPVEAVSWVAREFVLVHSLLGQTRHVLLGRWPLRESPARDPQGGEYR